MDGEDELNAYYKHILHMVKIGKYRDDIPVTAPLPDDPDGQHYAFIKHAMTDCKYPLFHKVEFNTAIFNTV